mgnify:CR=1 FL=1|tara:strand:- start:15089 stop:15637 length:549 start_codon:yes stop_codon:yes gene_type:complete
MKAITLLLLGLTTMPTIAETENFDMSLTGGFGKDYCELITLADYSSDLDVPKAHEGKGPDEKVTEINLYTAQLAIKCSGGTYDFEFSTTSPNEYETTPSGITYFSRFQFWQQSFLTSPANSGIQNIYAQAPFISNNNVFRSDFQGSITFFYQIKAFSADGSWDNLPDSYSFPTTLVITVDKH